MHYAQEWWLDRSLRGYIFTPQSSSRPTPYSALNIPLRPNTLGRNRYPLHLSVNIVEFKITSAYLSPTLTDCSTGHTSPTRPTLQAPLCTLRHPSLPVPTATRNQSRSLVAREKGPGSNALLLVTRTSHQSVLPRLRVSFPINHLTITLTPRQSNCVLGLPAIRRCFTPHLPWVVHGEWLGAFDCYRAALPPDPCFSLDTSHPAFSTIAPSHPSPSPSYNRASLTC